MSINTFEVHDDTLIRYIPVCGQKDMMEGVMVITKEEFIACYNSWIKGGEDHEID